MAKKKKITRRMFLKWCKRAGSFGIKYNTNGGMHGGGNTKITHKEM